MKAWIFLAIVLLVACTPKTTILDAVAETEKLDQKYALQNANFRDERLLEKMVDYEAIPDMLKDLENTRERVLANAGQDREIMFAFFHAREQMLRSQYSLIQATKLGKRAFVNQSVICVDKELILEGDRLLREAIKTGINATSDLDAVLQKLVERNDEKGKQAVGISKTRPKFYYSDFQSLANQAEKNRLSVEKYC